MSVVRKNIIIACVGLSLTFLVTACNNSKSSQCERLIKVVNKGSDLIGDNKAKQVTTSLKLAQDLETIAKEIKELKLQDSKLKEFQIQFVNVFETFSKSFATAAKAFNSEKTAPRGSAIVQKARGDIETALTKASITGKQSDAIATQMNKYCSKPN
ncbi:hypothetical protein G7B40_039505 [Aetokthonos hydrillicola Thurmond2011]|jgi:hypothetical protein|uniref:Lipoprotein n=1 Tax=Aetokthonos hydrillicola Thurmond2011 TaxID=2712845 RepID=A0AAP5IGX3_9CYAN|nr:hypothetical protein [Aetokthonos hydrillicola]MBO3461697.1 hypothetical protein [Aetokthonos hydrillicola CCALA 1050]MBW4589997.1 hypothetical protein [Aetokthonos hydrillicola CCALA 1050]MDR9900579.1 hypothetical protein [Aetokthonos hydrillicola Thurmond2011]